MQIIDKETFIRDYASGTLNKSHKMGLATHDHFLEEWLAFYVGYQFETLQETRVTTGKVPSEGDCKAITELVWFCQSVNYKMQLATTALGLKEPPKFEPRYFNIEYQDGSTVEGVGLLATEKGDLLKTYISETKMVFAITCEVKHREFQKSISPF